MTYRDGLLMVSAALVLIGQDVLAQSSPGTPSHAQYSETGAFTVESLGDTIVCRSATAAEARSMRRDLSVQLHEITPPTLLRQPEAGLSIILRATSQLESFPAAKAAFQRAAATWMSLIQSPVTIVIDVDYGPTRFGTPYSSASILGSTLSQVTGSAAFYQVTRTALVSHASSASESALYGLLPSPMVPNDLGSTSALYAPTAPLRALGLLSAAADPSGEQVQLGDPPSIGFNSAFSFDFDPSNGIDSDKTDFDAVAVHEIGHALGFFSMTGGREQGQGYPPGVGLWDLFRFRPGDVALTGFTNANRTLSSGGSQVFYGGGSELALSTGRPDGTGGDGNQASHWKDQTLTGVYIGIMNPTIGKGVRRQITQNDLAALDVMGYTMSGTTGSADFALSASPTSLSLPKGGTGLLTISSAASGGFNSSVVLSVSGDFVSSGLVSTSFSPASIGAPGTGSSTLTISTLGSTPAGTFSVTVNGAGGGVSHSIQVPVSVYSPTGSVPAAPNGLGASTRSSTQIDLFWTDYSNNETEFRIESRTGSAGYSDIGSVGANTTSTTVNGLTPGTTYTFRVKARNASGDSGYSNEATASTSGGGGGSVCTQNVTTLCLNGSRFKVETTWRTNDGRTGAGSAVRLTGDTGYFTFFDAANVEMVVKVLNGCFAPFNSYWVFAGGLTNVKVDMTVTDTKTGTVKRYSNPIDTAFQPIQDTGAFPSCP